KLPIFVPIRAKPISGIIAPFVCEAHGNSVFVVSPKLFDQPIVEFFGPLALQKLNDLCPSSRELGAVSPARIGRIGESHLFRVTQIPSVFGRTKFLNGSLASERR